MMTDHDAVARVADYHPRVWLTLVTAHAVMSELPPDYWPPWVALIFGAYRSDFVDADNCCRGICRCTGGLLVIDDEARRAADDLLSAQSRRKKQQR